MPDSLSTLTSEAVTLYEKVMLITAKAAQVFYDLGKMTPIGQNMGNTAQWRRLERLAINVTQLTEGVTPNETAMTVTPVSTTIHGYGAFVGYTDDLDVMGIDKIAAESIEMLGQHAGESVDTLVANVVKAGTSVTYATGTTRVQQDNAVPFTLALLRKSLTKLKVNNAKPFGNPPSSTEAKSGKGYILVVHPRVEEDLWLDAEFKATVEQNPNNSVFWNGMIGTVMGVKVLVSTLAPVFTAAGLASDNVYGSLLFAEDSFGVVNVGGDAPGKYVLKTKAFGQGGMEDILDQRAGAGWKARQAPVILNNAFLDRIESGATNG